MAKPLSSPRRHGSDALRQHIVSFAVSLGLVTSERAKRCVAAAQNSCRAGGVRRRAAAGSVPLPIYGNNGKLLTIRRTVLARYKGGEDTRRKPAVSHGTAWT